MSNKMKEINYHEFSNLRSKLNTDFEKSDLLDILDMAMQLGDIDQAVIDFCNANDISNEDLEDI